MSKRRRLLIVLADGEHARFVRPGADSVLRTEATEDSPRAHAHAIAQQLNEAEANEEFDSLLLVAPAHTLNAIREHLNAAAAGRIISVLEKDIVKVPDHELAPHLFPWVRQAKRVPPYEATGAD